MANEKSTAPTSSQYSPTMTQDYSRISDTARAVDSIILPKITSYIQRIASQIATTPSEKPFVIADYGSVDGVNSSELFEKIIRQLHSINASLRIKLIYIDIASADYFDKFWANSNLAYLERMEGKYIKRSFYEPFPEITGRLNIEFSSTSLH